MTLNRARFDLASGRHSAFMDLSQPQEKFEMTDTHNGSISAQLAALPSLPMADL